MTLRIHVQPAQNPLHYINKKELTKGAALIAISLFYPFESTSSRCIAMGIGLSSISSSLTQMNEVISKKAQQTLLKLQLSLFGGAMSILGVAYWKV